MAPPAAGVTGSPRLGAGARNAFSNLWRALSLNPTKASPSIPNPTNTVPIIDDIFTAHTPSSADSSLIGIFLVSRTARRGAIITKDRLCLTPFRGYQENACFRESTGAPKKHSGIPDRHQGAGFRRFLEHWLRRAAGRERYQGCRLTTT
jgi:hypothetical protein